MQQQLLAKINDRTAVVGIIGLGYVGLPLAMEFAKADSASLATTSASGSSTC
jgi:UDP-N-acetyl-D-mannosaminuronate dehydrogenase